MDQFTLYLRDRAGPIDDGLKVCVPMLALQPKARSLDHYNKARRRLRENEQAL
jgi:hypothetical protein